jgi:hypothetical protein
MMAFNKGRDDPAVVVPDFLLMAARAFRGTVMTLGKRKN